MTTPHFDIDLSPSRVLCSFHPLPWKETWESPESIADVMKFCLSLFDILCGDKNIIRKCTLPGEEKASISLLNKMMPRPLCCWVVRAHPGEIEKIYESLGVEPPTASAQAIRN